MKIDFSHMLYPSMYKTFYDVINYDYEINK